MRAGGVRGAVSGQRGRLGERRARPGALWRHLSVGDGGPPEAVLHQIHGDPQLDGRGTKDVLALALCRHGAGPLRGVREPSGPNRVPPALTRMPVPKYRTRAGRPRCRAATPRGARPPGVNQVARKHAHRMTARHECAWLRAAAVLTLLAAVAAAHRGPEAEVRFASRGSRARHTDVCAAAPTTTEFRQGGKSALHSRRHRLG
jgi:hypothetical protein